ncbi:ABC transporter permease [Paenibacillaceae bacterium]|nr:ABC transporter permease [Paenibacillaceae bacterium]
MSDFFQLILNENMKIYRRPRTWIMLGFMIALSLGIFIITFAIQSDGVKLTMWLPFEIATKTAIVFATIFAVVVSAESVAGEFSTGTIKLLLIRPWSRSKILLSKYISLLLFALFLLVVMFGLNYLVSLLMFGQEPGLTVGRGYSPIVYWTLYQFYEYIAMIVILTLSFLISTVFRSGGLSIGLSIFLLFSGSLISQILGALDYAWVKYLLFLHLGISDFLTSPVHSHGITLPFSLAVLGAYYVVFITITWVLFNRRDVAA